MDNQYVNISERWSVAGVVRMLDIYLIHAANI